MPFPWTLNDDKRGKMKKTLILTVIALALVGAFAYFWFSPSQVLKRAIEGEGSAIAGSAVTVEGVTWSRESRVFLVTGFTIANPAGFPAGKILVAPVIEIGLEPETPDQKVTRLNRLIVSAPRLNIESGPSGSNFEALERRIKEQKPQPGTQRWVVDLLAVQDAKVRLAGGSEADLLGVRSHDVGADQGGVSALELAQYVTEQVGQRVRLVAGIESIKSGIRSLLGE